jgi:hypothetical protein
VRHYQSGGITAYLIDKESPETVGREKAVKIEGKNVNLVIPKLATRSLVGGKAGELSQTIGKKVTVTHPVINFHHIVKGVMPRNDKEKSATMVVEKRGLLSMEIVGVRWEGGRVASTLNTDPDLKKKILTGGIDSLKVEEDCKNGCLRIVLRDKIDVVTESSGFLVRQRKNRVERLPSLETFEIVDDIAERIRGG